MKTKYSIVSILLLICLSLIFIRCNQSAVAQSTTKTEGIFPVMKITNSLDTSDLAIRLESMKINIKVVGQIAITTLDLSYYNPNDKILEGEFSFPLDETQSICRFALDINGKLREGVVVEKEKGRKTFEAVVRKNVDPGLLEMTKGNNFKARVYPIPAKGSRHLVIAFQQELTDKGTQDLYLLPLNIKEKLDKFSIRAEVFRDEVSFDSKENELNNISFKKWENYYVAEESYSDFMPDKNIAFSFPHEKEALNVYTTENRQYQDWRYFYLNLRPQLFESKKTLPSRITILWDNSSSAEKRDLNKELEILKFYLTKTNHPAIEIITFNIFSKKVKSFPSGNDNFNAISNYLKTIVYDGATSFGNIDFSSIKSDEILLFSDGLSNFGNEEIKYPKIPVYAINSSSISNQGFLSMLAQKSGGIYLNINKLTKDESIEMLLSNHYHFISTQLESGSITEIYPSIPSSFQNTFSMIGKLSSPTAVLILNFGFGNTITYSKRIEISNKSTGNEEIISRLWAEKKISELMINENKNLAEITETGKKFGIVTPNTSLIVLENLSDYVEHRIIPPKELQGEYFSEIAKIDKEKDDNIRNYIEEVVKLSEEQSKWWNTAYPLPNPKFEKRSGQVRSFQYDGYVNDAEIQDSTSVVILRNADASYNLTTSQNNAVSNEISNSSISVSSEFLWTSRKEDKQKGDIQIGAWDPKTPYYKALKNAIKGQEYKTYLKLKREYSSVPSFFADASDYFKEIGKNDTAILILSNLAEMELEAPQLLRTLAYKLSSLKQYNDACLIFKNVLELKKEEPQSYRDYGLALEANGNYQQAIETLYAVVKNGWDGRFPGIGLIVMNEINRIVNQHTNLNTIFIDKRLLKKEAVDIRVVLTWDTDNCDMDLWVTDPDNIKCFYSYNHTENGGKISNDFTQGYGPEEFMMKKALNGKYLIQANYYGTRSQEILAPVTLHLSFYTNYAKANQKMKEVTIRLKNKEEVINIGQFIFTKE